MANLSGIEKRRTGEFMLDGLSHAPPAAAVDGPMIPDVREARDAAHHETLVRDPAHADSKLEIALDESFPTSDPPAGSLPGSADPAPSSGFDEVAEAEIARERETAK